MPYASKELIERAVALVGRTVTYETINEYHAYHDVIEDLARDLAKATPLPTDAEHKAAIDGWRKEAMLVPSDPHFECYSVTTSEIDAICDLARRAPAQPVSDAYKLPAPDDAFAEIEQLRADARDEDWNNRKRSSMLRRALDRAEKAERERDEARAALIDARAEDWNTVDDPDWHQTMTQWLKRRDEGPTSNLASVVATLVRRELARGAK
jgi:hypothetical protein